MKVEKAKQREATAYHEAGHALAYLLTGWKFKYITIKPDKETDTIGHLMPYNKGEMFWYSMSVERLMNYCRRSLSGVIAEAIYTKRNNHLGARGDLRKVADMVLSVFGQDGPTVQFFLKFIRSDTRDLLLMNWNKVERIAGDLLKSETLSYQEVLAIANESVANQITS